MKLHGHRGMRIESGPNMTPLVDIVMVVLIFLMLAGKFGSGDHYMVSNVPISGSGAGGVTAPSGISKTVALDIRVDAPTPDRFVARAGRIQTSDPEELKGMLASMKEQLLAADPQMTVDDIQVKIGPGRNVKYRHLVAVYDAAMRADFKKITFSQAH